MKEFILSIPALDKILLSVCTILTLWSIFEVLVITKNAIHDARNWKWSFTLCASNYQRSSKRMVICALLSSLMYIAILIFNLYSVNLFEVYLSMVLTVCTLFIVHTLLSVTFDYFYF